MPSLVIGRVQPINQGNYDATRAYGVLDRVNYRGAWYECQADAAAGTAPEAGGNAYWLEIGGKGADGLTPTPVWNGSELHFEYSDGTTTSAVDLKGPQGVQGAQGPAGQTPPLTSDLTSTAADVALSALGGKTLNDNITQAANRASAAQATADAAQATADAAQAAVDAVSTQLEHVVTDVNNKADTDLTNASPTAAFAVALNNAGIRTVVETWHSGTEWYRVWSDGWIEQGGYKASGQSNGTVTFLKPFSDDNYSPHFTPYSAENTNTVGLVAHQKTATTCVFATQSWSQSYFWYACGY